MFALIQESPQNCESQDGDMKEVSNWELTNSKLQCAKFGRLIDLAPGFHVPPRKCVCLFVGSRCSRLRRQKPVEMLWSVLESAKGTELLMVRRPCFQHIEGFQIVAGSEPDLCIGLHCCVLFWVCMCYFVFFVYCIVVPLPPGTYPLAVNNNNNNNNNTV